MKRLGWMCTWVLAASLLGPTSWSWAQEDDGQEGARPKVRKNKTERKAKADRPAKARRVRKTEWEAFWQPFATRAKLTDKQTQQLKQIVQAKTDALAAWDKEHGEKVKELRKEMGEARKNDKDRAKELGQEMRELMAGRGKIDDAHRAKLLAGLTDAQKEALAAYESADGMVRVLRRAKLTPEQIARIHAMCDEQAVQLASADAKVARAADNEIRKAVLAQVLTDEQREGVKRFVRPERRAREPKADRPARKGKGNKAKRPADDEGDGADFE